MYFVKNTTMAAVLCESFFIDNSKDKTIGDTIDEQKALGVAYAKAILEYLGIAYKAPAKPASSSAKTYCVQVGSFSSKKKAEAMVNDLKAAGFDNAYVTTK